MKISFGNTQAMVLFAILFIVVGNFVPVLYAAYAPQGHYIEVNDFSAQDTTTADSSHLVCFDRDVKNANSGTIITQLYLVNGEDNTRLEVDSHTIERYFQEGDKEIKRAFPLPDNIGTGEYRYILVVDMDLAQDRVSREFAFTSEPFTVTESDTPQTSSKNLTKYTC